MENDNLAETMAAECIQNSWISGTEVLRDVQGFHACLLKETMEARRMGISVGKELTVWAIWCSSVD